MEKFISASTSERREDAGAAVPDQQMRVDLPRYPVDRYLVPSSNKFELVNIIDDDLWKSDPALRPEDEIILRKLQEMLQSTAGDLKILSGELAKFHQPGVQVKSQPTPLDEDFNEKIHIEEVVNAKFHGYKIIDPNINSAPKTKDIDGLKSVLNPVQKPKINNAIQVTDPVKKTLNRHLSITRPKIIQINGHKDKEMGTTKLNNGKVVVNKPTVAYNEFTFKYEEPKPKLNLHNNLQVQHMPSVNIRSELVEQKVVQLDIIPEVKDKDDSEVSNKNVAVISMEHEAIPIATIRNIQSTNYPAVTHSQSAHENRQPTRKVLKMSTCDSSVSTNSSDALHKKETFKNIRATLKLSPKNSARADRKGKKSPNKKDLVTKKSQPSLDEWKKKLNVVYGQATTSEKNAAKARRGSPKKTNIRSSESNKPQRKILNNAEYIPYSKLGIGGVKVSDIEREISNIHDKGNIPLSPVLDKILSSRENSFHDSPRRKHNKSSPRVLTTSDENLLQEVLDIERTVSETISKNIKNIGAKKRDPDSTSESSNNKDNESYDDDFEDDKSDDSKNSKKYHKRSNNLPDSKANNDGANNDTSNDCDDNTSDGNNAQDVQNKTYTKANLSFKESVEVFEFVHLVDTQDSATQSNTTRKISLKETQTSPVNEKSSIQPIHNDLWPSTSIDPRLEVENLFKLEKEFIKKLILDEYGEVLEKTLNKPSTSSDSNEAKGHKNVAAYQKNTQTSPAHVKSVMTSPTKTKTRTTSPFVSLRVDHQTSPIIVVTNEEQLNIEIDDNEEGISVNLSSPRFNLRLPQTSREVLSNLEVCSLNRSKSNASTRKKEKTPKARIESSSSSVDGDKSSSEISSLGEVKWRLKRQMKKHYDVTMSETSSSSVLSSANMPMCGIIPLRSEDESAGQVRKRSSKSEGETSLGQVLK